MSSGVTAVAVVVELAFNINQKWTGANSEQIILNEF